MNELTLKEKYELIMFGKNENTKEISISSSNFSLKSGDFIGFGVNKNAFFHIGNGKKGNSSSPIYEVKDENKELLYSFALKLKEYDSYSVEFVFWNPKQEYGKSHFVMVDKFVEDIKESGNRLDTLKNNISIGKVRLGELESVNLEEGNILLLFSNGAKESIAVGDLKERYNAEKVDEKILAKVEELKEKHNFKAKEAKEITKKIKSVFPNIYKENGVKKLHKLNPNEAYEKILTDFENVFDTTQYYKGVDLDITFGESPKRIVLNNHYTQKGKIYEFKDGLDSFQFSTYFKNNGKDIVFKLFSYLNNEKKYVDFPSNYTKSTTEFLNDLKKYNVNESITSKTNILGYPLTNFVGFSRIDYSTKEENKTKIKIIYENGNIEHFLELGDLNDIGDCLEVDEKIRKKIEELNKNGLIEDSEIKKQTEKLKSLVKELYNEKEYNKIGHVFNLKDNDVIENADDLELFVRSYVPEDDVWISNIRGENYYFKIEKEDTSIFLETYYKYGYNKISGKINFPIKKKDVLKTNVFQEFKKQYDSSKGSSESHAKGFQEYFKSSCGHKGNPVWMD
jgi:hypothetical protein